MRKRKTSRGRAQARGKQSAKIAQSAWIYGWHTVQAALANPRREPGRLLATAEAASRIKADFPDSAPEICSRPDIEAILPEGAVHQGIALLAPPPGEVGLDDILADVRNDTLVVVLDQVTDPHNVGAVLRSAAAFDAAAVIIQDRNAPRATSVLAKAASGALDIVPLVRVTNLARTLEALGRENFRRIGFDSEAPDALDRIEFDGRIALVLGAEGKGLRRLTREACDVMARIPAPGALASLNVSNAAAIALYESARRRRPPKDATP